jgi:hypothetical protein
MPLTIRFFCVIFTLPVVVYWADPADCIIEVRGARPEGRALQEAFRSNYDAEKLLARTFLARPEQRLFLPHA